MKKRYLVFLLSILVLSDLALINASFYLGLHITNKMLVTIDPSIYFQNIWSCSIIWIISSAIFRLYTYNIIQNLKSFFIATAGSVIVFGGLFIGYLMYTHQTNFPVEIFASLFPLIGMSFILSRMTATAIIEKLPEEVIVGKQGSTHQAETQN